MSPEAKAGGNPPEFTYEERVFMHNRGHSVLPDERFEHPADQIEVWCEIARDEQFEGEIGETIVRKSLDTAVAAAEAMEDDSLEFPRHDGYYGPVTPFVTIARTAWSTGQEPEYVRDILDKALSKSGLYDDGRPPALQSLQLQLLAQAAYETGQGPDYILPLIDRWREVNNNMDLYKPIEERIEGRAQRLEKVVTDAQGYGLGKDYVQDALDAEIKWQRFAGTDPSLRLAKIGHLAGIARIAHTYLQDPDYVRAILDEGREIAGWIDGKTAADWESGVQAYANLVKTARDVGESEEYVTDTVFEGIYGMEHPSPYPRRRTLRSLNTLLRAMDGSTELHDGLQAYLILKGLRFIEKIEDPAREPQARESGFRHLLLNSLLSGVELSENIQIKRGLQRKPYGYAFKPDSDGKPGVLPTKPHWR